MVLSYPPLIVFPQQREQTPSNKRFSAFVLLDVPSGSLLPKNHFKSIEFSNALD